MHLSRLSNVTIIYGVISQFITGARQALWLGAGLAINRSRVRLPDAALPSSDPGQVVHTCPAPLKLRPYGAIEI